MTSKSGKLLPSCIPSRALSCAPPWPWPLCVREDTICIANGCCLAPCSTPPSLRNMAIRASHSRSRVEGRCNFAVCGVSSNFSREGTPPRPSKETYFISTHVPRTSDDPDGRKGVVAFSLYILRIHIDASPKKYPIPFGKQPPPIHRMVIYMSPHPSVSPPLLFSFHPLTYCPFVYRVP